MRASTSSCQVRASRWAGVGHVLGHWLSWGLEDTGFDQLHPFSLGQILLTGTSVSPGWGWSPHPGLVLARAVPITSMHLAARQCTPTSP